MKTNAIKQSTKPDWWIVKTIEFAPVIALARDKYLNPFEEEEGVDFIDKQFASCEAVSIACNHVFGDHVCDAIADAYVTWASELGLRSFDTQHERILWLSFLEQYCRTERVVLECKVNTNPFSDDYDTRLFEIKSTI